MIRTTHPILMKAPPTDPSLAAVAEVYSRTRGYRRSLEELPAGGVPQLAEWTAAVGLALSGLEDAVARAVIHHEMWPWIVDRVQANPVITGRLLARLNPERADSPSSFWRYCGLATVPAIALRCDRCGRIIHHATAFSNTCSRPAGSSGLKCGGSFHPTPAASTVRIAQRWTHSGAGGRQPYDPEARTAAYLLGHDLIQRSGRYADAYRRELARLKVERPAWAQQHRFRAARRRVIKAFLADLWQAWRSTKGLPTERA